VMKVMSPISVPVGETAAQRDCPQDECVHGGSPCMSCLIELRFLSC
jgi:hypothetical protein